VISPAPAAAAAPASPASPPAAADIVGLLAARKKRAAASKAAAAGPISGRGAAVGGDAIGARIQERIKQQRAQKLGFK